MSKKRASDPTEEERGIYAKARQMREKGKTYKEISDELAISVRKTKYWTGDIRPTVMTDELYIEARKMRKEGKTHKEIGEKLKISTRKSIELTKGIRLAKIPKELLDMVKQNPDISFEDLKKQFPELPLTRIKRFTNPLRRQSQNDCYIDPKTKQVYYNVSGLAELLGLEDQTILSAIKKTDGQDKHLSVIWVLKTIRSKFIRYYNWIELLEAIPEYKRRAQEIKLLQEDFGKFKKVKLSGLPLAAIMTLAALLINKNTYDYWLSEEEIHSQLHDTYHYEPVTIHNAVQMLITKGYLVIRRSSSGKNNRQRTFWATRKCPMGFISTTERLENGKLVRVFRDYVKVEQRVQMIASTAVERLLSL